MTYHPFLAAKKSNNSKFSQIIPQIHSRISHYISLIYSKSSYCKALSDTYTNIPLYNDGDSRRLSKTQSRSESPYCGCRTKKPSASGSRTIVP